MLRLLLCVQFSESELISGHKLSRLAMWETPTMTPCQIGRAVSCCWGSLGFLQFRDLRAFRVSFRAIRVKV